MCTKQKRDTAKVAEFQMETGCNTVQTERNRNETLPNSTYEYIMSMYFNVLSHLRWVGTVPIKIKGPTQCTIPGSQGISVAPSFIQKKGVLEQAMGGSLRIGQTF